MKCRRSNLDFYPYKGEKIPKDFEFDIKNKELVDFLNKKAKKCVGQLVSKVFIIRDKDKTFLGYIALTLKSIKKDDLKAPKTGGIYDRPALVIGQLIIDERCRRQGCGKIVLTFVIAVARLLRAFLPLRLLVVEALHDEAKEYYEHQGFESTPDDPYTLVFDMYHILKK